ncbi:MAG: AAA family ATPase [Succinivibrionaceae bacterium]|nr:AAA family ATPase [Succinivibrionaceae bacterium]
MTSNGETAMRHFVEHISENAIYLLDEPENSLAIPLQQELSKYIYDSARHFNCQFIIASHSPVMLAIEDALIYDLDSWGAPKRKWTELPNIRLFYEFFMRHSGEFEEAGDERSNPARRSGGQSGDAGGSEREGGGQS